MPNIANVLREEIQRLARKQVKAGLGPLKRDNVRLKKSVAELRRRMIAIDRTIRQLLKQITPVVATRETEQAVEKAARIRPTSKGLDKLRRRLGLTQVQFGRLLGVSAQAVIQWAAKDGRVRMRQKTLAALAGIQSIGKREALRRLEAMDVSTPAPRKRRPKRTS